MAFDWSEYLALARHLQGQESSRFSQEAALRCSISRAYLLLFAMRGTMRGIVRDLFPPIELKIMDW